MASFSPGFPMASAAIFIIEYSITAPAQATRFSLSVMTVFQARFEKRG